MRPDDKGARKVINEGPRLQISRTLGKGKQKPKPFFKSEDGPFYSQ